MDLIPGRFRRERTNEPCQLNLALSLMTACTSVEASAVTNWSHSRSARPASRDRKSTRLNSSHSQISYAVFCLKKKNAEGDEDNGLRRPQGRDGLPRRMQLPPRPHARDEHLPRLLWSWQPDPRLRRSVAYRHV